MPYPVIAQNIAQENERILHLQECRFAHLRELANQLHKEFASAEQYLQSEAFYKRYIQQMQGLLPPTEDVPPPHKNDVLRQNHLLRAEAAVYFVRAICSLYRQSGRTLAAEDFCIPPSAEQFPYHSDRIAYLKNTFSDTAYEKFSRMFRTCTASYCDDFQSVCEEVAQGRAKYGILPWENTKDGRLKTFENLVQKHDLKLILLSTVPMGEDLTQFVLFGRRVQELDCARQKERSFLSIRVRMDDTAPWHAPSLSLLLSAASYFGMYPERISSTATAENEYDLTFVRDSADTAAFLCYLTLEFPQFIPIGLYTLLKH